MKIEQIRYNWFYSSVNGEEYQTYTTVGLIDNIDNIKEHVPLFEGDKYFCIVTFNDGHVEKIFNINLIIYVKDEVDKFCDKFLEDNYLRKER